MQCDILLNALISVKAQNLKWDAKVQSYYSHPKCINEVYFRDELRLFGIFEDEVFLLVLLGQRSGGSNCKHEPNAETENGRTSEAGDELRKIQGSD